MASEFLYVLVAGAAVLVVGGVLAGFADQTAAGDEVLEGGALFSENIGSIGDIQATSRTIEFGDVNVEAMSQASQVAGRDTVQVGSNVLRASSETLTFEADQQGQVHVSFVPSSSTDPGNLVVRVNGERVQVPEFTPGEEVSVTASASEGSNTATFTAEKPGASFWRTPSYTLRDVGVSVSYPRTVKPFRAFEYEVDGFDRGELSFSVSGEVVREQPLDVKINGNTVMSSTPVARPLPYTEDFHANTTGLSAGENVLSLSTSGSSSYPLENLRMTLYFFAGTQQRTVVRDFGLTGPQYRSLGQDNGRITLEVDRVTLQRPVTVSLPNATFIRALDAGTNTFSFGKDAVSPGVNSLQISTDGSYRVDPLTVSISGE